MAVKPRRLYVDTERGQILVRHWFDRPTATPLVMLHWTPVSGRQFADVAPLIVTRGVQVFALDLPGYGQSDAREPNADGGDWLIPDFASCLAQAIRALGLTRIALYGGHVSAAIASQIAQDEKQLVARVILDGCPCWPEEVRRQILAAVAPGYPTVAADESHARIPYDKVMFFLREWMKGVEVTNALLPRVYDYMADLLATRFASSSAALGAFAMETVLPGIAQPTLVLTAENDPLGSFHAGAMSLLSNARDHRFAGNHPLHDPARAEEFAAAVAAFAKPGA
jgi:pimeloyl-ACP methyl ester carboxylesterase